MRTFLSQFYGTEGHLAVRLPRMTCPCIIGLGRKLSLCAWSVCFSGVSSVSVCVLASVFCPSVSVFLCNIQFTYTWLAMHWALHSCCYSQYTSSLFRYLYVSLVSGHCFCSFDKTNKPFQGAQTGLTCMFWRASAKIKLISGFLACVFEVCNEAHHDATDGALRGSSASARQQYNIGCLYLIA